MAPPDSSSGETPARRTKYSGKAGAEAYPPSFRVAELRRIPATHSTTGKAPALRTTSGGGRGSLHKRVEENTFHVVGYVITSFIYL